MELNDAIDRYVASRRNQGYAPNTVRADRQTLRQLMAATGNIQVRSLQPRHIDMLLAQHPDWTPGTYNLKRAQMSMFFKWARANGAMGRDQDPLATHRKAPGRPRKGLVLPPERFPELLAAAEARHPRDRMVVALGLYAFLRSSEIVELLWSHAHLQDGHLEVYRRKTGQYDSLPICAELDEELRRWRMQYELALDKMVEPTWRICPPLTSPRYEQDDHGKLTILVASPIPVVDVARRYSAPHQAVQRALAALGFDTAREGGHTLRRSGGVALYRRLVHLGHDGAGRVVQSMYGHANFATTERYLRLDLERKRRDDILRGVQMFDPPKPIDVDSPHGEGDSRGA